MKKILLFVLLILTTNPIFGKCLEHRFLLLEGRDEMVLERINGIKIRIEKEIQVQDEIFKYPVRYHREENKSCYENYRTLRFVANFQRKKLISLNDYIDQLKISYYPKIPNALPLNPIDQLSPSENFYLYLEDYLTFLEKELNLLGL